MQGLIYWRGRHKSIFLWLCYRADFNKDHFINEDIEREDLRDLKKDVHSKRDTDVAALEAHIAEEAGKYRETCLKLARRVEGLEERLFKGTNKIKDTMDEKLDQILKRAKALH